MTVRRFSTLFCDADDGGCGEWADVDDGVGTHDDARSLRRAAKRRGWTRAKVGDRWQDFCPAHRLRGEGLTNG
jgi:hypothetical protein